MRDIRFRGWHVGQKKMYSAEELATDQLTLLTTGCFINVDGSNTELSEKYSVDRFVPLQFTGLTDKNGVDIFEGDILKGYSELNDYEFQFTSPVIYHKDLALFGFPVTTVGSYKLPLENYNNALLNAQMWRTEVIGNIYENPYLLTEQPESDDGLLS